MLHLREGVSTVVHGTSQGAVPAALHDHLLSLKRGFDFRTEKPLYTLFRRHPVCLSLPRLPMSPPRIQLHVAQAHSSQVLPADSCPSQIIGNKWDTYLDLLQAEYTEGCDPCISHHGTLPIDAHK